MEIKEKVWLDKEKPIKIKIEIMEWSEFVKWWNYMKDKLY